MSDKRSGKPVMTNLSSPYSGPYGEGTGVDIALQTWTNLRIVRSGQFSAEEVYASVNHFYDSLTPFSPVLSSVSKHPSQHSKLLEREPILTVSILMLGTLRFLRIFFLFELDFES